jgi:hypothetical protein
MALPRASGISGARKRQMVNHPNRAPTFESKILKAINSGKGLPAAAKMVEEADELNFSDEHIASVIDLLKTQAELREQLQRALMAHVHQTEMPCDKPLKVGDVVDVDAEHVDCIRNVRSSFRIGTIAKILAYAGEDCGGGQGYVIRVTAVIDGEHLKKISSAYAKKSIPAYSWLDDPAEGLANND